MLFYQISVIDIRLSKAGKKLKIVKVARFFML